LFDNDEVDEVIDGLASFALSASFEDTGSTVGVTPCSIREEEFWDTKLTIVSTYDMLMLRVRVTTRMGGDEDGDVSGDDDRPLTVDAESSGVHKDRTETE
jgi:hypothetical protein